MVMITDIRHFLDDDGNVPDLSVEAMNLLGFLTAVIEQASEKYDAPISFLENGCRCVVEGESCPGEVEVWVFAEDNRIGWECLECGDEGIITNWEGTRWDKRSYTRH